MTSVVGGEWALPDGSVRLILGDCLAVLPTFVADTFDAIVTDPPAGIGFMGKEWDDFRRARNEADVGRGDVFGRTSARAPEIGRRPREAFVGWLTAVAAYNEHFRIVGIEQEEEYYRTAIERMEREAKRHPLLEPPKPKQRELI